MTELEDVLKDLDSNYKKKMDEAIDTARSLMMQDMTDVSREMALAGILEWQFKMESDDYFKLAKEVLDTAANDPAKGGANIKDWDELVREVVDYYENGSATGLSTGFNNLDDFYTITKGQLTVVTGIPSHGKSEFMDQIIINTIDLHDWNWLVFSPENYPLKFHMDKLLSKITDMPFRINRLDRMTRVELDGAMKKIRNNVDFLSISEYGTTLDAVLMVAKKKENINGLIIDPWNEIENKRRRGQSETEWIGESLSKIRRFARANNIGVWVVAHPTKIKKVESGDRFEVPTAYDIMGSSHWYNRADNILTVYRNEKDVEVFIQKVKFKTNGKKGAVKFDYDVPTGIYEEASYAGERE